MDGAFSTQGGVYHIQQLERFGAIVEGLPGHANGQKVAEVQGFHVALVGLDAATLFRRQKRICQFFGAMSFFGCKMKPPVRGNLQDQVFPDESASSIIAHQWHCLPNSWQQHIAADATERHASSTFIY